MSGLPRCPKCRKQTYELTVITEETTKSDVVDGRIEFMGQAALPQPVRAYGDCRCGHTWQIRNAASAQLHNDRD